MGLDLHGDQQIAGGAAVAACVALAPQGDGLAVVDTGGDIDLDGFALAGVAAALAVGAGLMDDLARAAALGAGGLTLHDAEGGALGLGDHACAPALGTHLRRGALGAAVAAASGTVLAALDGDLLLTAEGRLGKFHRQAYPDALAPLGAGAGTAAAAEAAAEKAAEDVAQVAEVEARGAVAPAGAASPGAIAGVYAGEAELVIPGLLVRVGQHLVGLIDLLELLLGLLVAGVHVRVVLPGQLFIGFFDLFLRGPLADA